LNVPASATPIFAIVNVAELVHDTAGPTNPQFTSGGSRFNIIKSALGVGAQLIIIAIRKRINPKNNNFYNISS